LKRGPPRIGKGSLFLGIHIGGPNIKMAILGGRGKLLGTHSLPSEVDKGPEDAFARMAGAVPLLGSRKSLRSVGVACAGLVNQVDGMLHSSPNLPRWANAPLAAIARKHFGARTVIENDANAAGYGEYFLGIGEGKGTMICLTLGTGVGGAVVIDGRLLRGSKNYAGEVGHTSICETGPRCSCGNQGCLEAYVGAYALIREARELVARGATGYLSKQVEEGRPLTPRLIAEAAARGDRGARGIFEEAGSHLGTGIANLINIFNPDLVVVAGGVAKGFHLMRPHVMAQVRKRAFPESRRAARIVRARLGTRAAAVGAALLARDTEFPAVS